MDPGQRHWVDVDRNPDATATAGAVVVRPESGLFCTNADNVHAAITDQLDKDTTAQVLDLASVPVIDVTATEMLVDLADDLECRDNQLRFARDVGQVRDLIEHAGSAQPLDHVHPTVDDAAPRSTTVT